MASVTFDRNVFQIRDPPCMKCHEEMDFKLFENFNNSGIDWLQWCCRNTNCGTCINVEIL